jgi:hypothetical protein
VAQISNDLAAYALPSAVSVDVSVKIDIIIRVGIESVTVVVVMWTPMVCMACVGQDAILDIPFHPVGWYILMDSSFLPSD